MDIRGIIEIVGLVVESAGVAVIFLWSLAAGVGYARRRLGGSEDPDASYRQLRETIGRGVLLGLELLVAGDIIRTVAVEPTFQSVGVLAIIVLIRTFLSFTLEVELNGRWPWNRREKGQGDPTERAV